MDDGNSPRVASTSLKVDKDDVRASRHFYRTVFKDGKEVKIWECGLCGKEFKFQYTLVRHIPTHTDVRNYQCSMCPKAFRQLSTLAQHKVTHLNLRPFICDFCNKSFNRISTLISHKKIHYDVKRHVCSYCGKGFHQKGNLRNHMYTHTNARPYKCDTCFKGFNQKSNLVCHKISTHMKKKFFCKICRLQFTREVSYNSHMTSIHQISASTSLIEPAEPFSSFASFCNNNEGETSSVQSPDTTMVSLKGSEQPKIIQISQEVENNGISRSMNSTLRLKNHFEGLMNQGAVVYTKTEPNLRVSKRRVNIPSHENTLDDCCLWHGKCLECSSKALTVDGATFLSNVKPSSPTIDSPVHPPTTDLLTLSPVLLESMKSLNPVPVKLQANSSLEIMGSLIKQETTQDSVESQSSLNNQAIKIEIKTEPLSYATETEYQELIPVALESVNEVEILLNSDSTSQFQAPVAVDVPSNLDFSLLHKSEDPMTIVAEPVYETLEEKDNSKFILDFDCGFDIEQIIESVLGPMNSSTTNNTENEKSVFTDL